MTASVAERGRRRWLELQADGQSADLATVTEGVRSRDALDQARAAAPLRPAPDAMTLDTTELDADSAFARALALVGPRLGLS